VTSAFAFITNSSEDPNPRGELQENEEF